MRTADGRVATLLSKEAGGYWKIKVDGQEKNVYRKFFASDGQDLPRLLASVPDKDVTKKKKKAPPPQDTPMRLRDKEGEIVSRTTMRAWSSTSGRDVPKGYEPHHEIVVKVPLGWMTARWSKSTGCKTIDHATVDGHKVWLVKAASTARGADGLHVLDIDRLKFRPRGDVGIHPSHGPGVRTVGTDAREASPWRDGAVYSTGNVLRALLTAEVLDTKEVMRVASEQFVAPSRYVERDGCHLREVKVSTFDGHGRYHFGCRAKTPDGAIYLCAVAAVGNVLEQLKEENIENSPYYQRLSSQDLKDAARAAREGRPWKVQNLDDFRVPNAIGTQTRVLSDGSHRHAALVGPQTYQRVPSAQTAYDMSQRRNSRCKAKAERDRATALKYHELCALDGRTPKYELPEKVGTFAGASGTGGRKAARREMLLLDAANSEATYVVSKQIEGIRAAPPGEIRCYDVFFVGRDRGLSDYPSVLQKRDRIWDLAEKEDDALAAFRRLALAEKFHEDVLRAAGHTVIKSDEEFLEYYDWFSMLKGGKNVIKEALVLAPKATPSAEINQRPASRSWRGAHAVDLPRASAAFARGTGPMRTKI